MNRPALLAAAVAALILAPAAHAHGPFDPRVRVVVDGLVPASAAVRVVASYDVQGLPPHMTARNDGTVPLEILAIGGEPLFRIGPDGSFGNVRSPSYRPSVDPFRSLPAPAPRPGTGPDWRKLSSEPAWRWFEDRAGFHARVPREIASQRGPVELATWRIHARLGGRDASINGRIVWRVPSGSIRARVLKPAWARDGLEVTALHGPVPGLQVRNTTGTVLEVTGRDNVPFARVGASGVDVNTQSLTWADTKGIPQPAGGGPAWRHETDLPVLIWMEQRAAYEQQDPPRSIERGGKEAVLVRWEVPGYLGAKQVLIKGETYWRPLRTKPSGSPVPLIATGAIVVVVLLVAARRRRGVASSPG